jgi:hypothetical protein
VNRDLIVKALAATIYRILATALITATAIVVARWMGVAI